VILLGPIFSALDIVDVSSATARPIEEAAEVYFTLGDRLRLHWLRRHIEALPRDNRWRTLARSALRDDLYGQQAALTTEVLRSGGPGDAPVPERVEAWLEANRAPVDRALQVLADINSSGTFDLSTLSVALREIRNLTTSSGASSPETAAAPAP
jgi:glutamate dehydrogenase